MAEILYNIIDIIGYHWAGVLLPLIYRNIKYSTIWSSHSQINKTTLTVQGSAENLSCRSGLKSTVFLCNTLVSVTYGSFF